MIMKIVCFGILLMLSCTQPAKDLSEQAAKEIREADIAMNDLAAREGFNKALLAYADSSLIKPQEGQYPISGLKALEAHYAGKEGTKDISWKPFKAEAAASGEMGYSLGNWKYTSTDTTEFGYYYTIWKKQADGKWKWTVDGGNTMPGEFSMEK